MESPEDVEKALGRLMPSALSDRGQRALERTIDSLAAGGPVETLVSAPAKASWWPLAIGMPAAAAAAFAVAHSLPRGGETADPVATVAPPSDSVRSVVQVPMDLDDVPMKVFDTSRRTAEFEWRDGLLRLEFREGVAGITVTTGSGDTLYQGPLDAPDVPEPWSSRGESLRRDLLRKIAESPPVVE